MTGNMRERLSSDLLECVSNVWSFVYYKIVNQKRSVSESASDGGGMQTRQQYLRDAKLEKQC